MRRLVRLRRIGRRILAIGLLLLILTLAWKALPGQLLDSILDQQQRADDARRLLTAYQRTLSRAPTITAQLETIRQHQAADGGDYKGDSGAIASASMQNDARQLVEAQGGTINSTMVDAPVVEGAFERIQVSITLTLSAEQIPALLYAIESHSPYLFVIGMTVTANESVTGDTPSPAMLTLQLAGYHLMEDRP